MPRPIPAPDDEPPPGLATLRARLARLEGGGRPAQAQAAIPLCEGLGLPGGGLARAALHEVLAATPGCGAAFCALLLARSGGTVLWITAGEAPLRPWPPGLAGCGLTPERLVLARAKARVDALWAMEEALRCPAVSGALLAGDGAAPDLTATRRLQLAAEAGGALGLLLRPDEGGAGPLAPSAAVTRWRVAALPGDGAPRWRLELLRARGGAPGGPWAVRWHAAEGRLALDGP
ncbi:hypothetical protein E0493_11865 [Roseomonas sp. M0104]|uniref:Protein ImuA n=1 Tax=Teichococcus coralli TaxID=2545983 RepID=A0A845BD49_9PROT|nr:hypothetical protein [Pseudoroseomonas coralli]MXP64040.1 hypothetical protein [Pseudoroseomonas coralli]